MPDSEWLDEPLRTLRENADASDRNAEFPRASFAAIRRAGLLGLTVPKQYGGSGLALDAFAQVAQKLGGACLSTSMIWAMHCQQVDVIVRHADSELAQGVLSSVARGETYLASVTSDRPVRGGDTAPSHLRSPGEAGQFERYAPVVTGGAYADGFLIALRLSNDQLDQRLSLVYANRSELTLQESGTWDALGMRGTHSVAMHIEGTASQGRVIGSPGGYSSIAADSMAPMAYIGWSSCWLGAARARFADLVTWLRSRERDGGPDERSALVRERLARIRIDLELSHSYLMNCVDELTQARSDGGPLSQDAKIHLNVLKTAVSELSFRAVDRMIDLVGLSNGYMKSMPLGLERTFRDLRSAALNYSNDRLLVEIGGLVLTDRSVTLL